MIIFDTLDSINNTTPCAIALGLFDGLHKGHRAVISSTFGLGLAPAVFTFTMNNSRPDSKRNFAPLMTVEERKNAFEKLGVKLLLMPDFLQFAEISPESFVLDILFDKMKAEVICCGYDFRFGKNGAGDTELLKKLCEENGRRLCVTAPVTAHGITVSSTNMRKALTAGDMESYFEMCDRFFTVNSEVIHGNRVGRRMNFPTINQSVSTQVVVPRFGVYASLARVDGVEYPAVSNIGIKPTVSTENTPLCETFILDFSGDLYGKKVSVELLSFLRDERKFSSTEELKAQISRDSANAKAFFDRRS